jgi:thymidylate synthase (FAD)
MKVDLLAFTAITPTALEVLEYQRGTAAADHLAELGGRECYQSFHRPNSKTAENKDYLRHILEIDHTSIMEHSSATFRLTEVSRNLLVELTRHRHLSFSVQSQRYVDESYGQMIIPPDIMGNAALSGLVEKIDHFHQDAKILYDEIVDTMMKEGYKRKQARQAARAVLPGGHETRIIVTGNIRAWRHVIHMRFSEHADVEIREMAGKILAHLRVIAPNQMQDISSDPRQ